MTRLDPYSNHRNGDSYEVMKEFLWLKQSFKSAAILPEKQ